MMTTRSGKQTQARGGKMKKASTKKIHEKVGRKKLKEHAAEHKAMKKTMRKSSDQKKARKKPGKRGGKGKMPGANVMAFNEENPF